MGMAASQARLLSITSRIADNELKAQIINNSKMRLATESSRVSEDYIQALNSATMMISNYDEAGNSQFQKLTFNNLTSFSSYNNQYALVDPNGRMLVSEKEAKMFNDAGGDLNKYLKAHNLELKTTYFDKLKSTLGGNIYDPQFYDETTGEMTSLRAGGYSIDDYIIPNYDTYKTNIQSVEYEDYINYYNDFILKESNYEYSVYPKVKEMFQDRVRTLETTVNGMHDMATAKTACDAIRNFLNNNYNNGGINDYLGNTSDTSSYGGSLYQTVINDLIHFSGFTNTNCRYEETYTRSEIAEDGSFKFGPKLGDSEGQQVYAFKYAKNSEGTFVVSLNDESTQVYNENGSLVSKTVAQIFEDNGIEFRNFTANSDHSFDITYVTLEEVDNTDDDDTHTEERTTTVNYNISGTEVYAFYDTEDYSYPASRIEQAMYLISKCYVMAVADKVAEGDETLTALAEERDNAQKALLEYLFGKNGAVPSGALDNLDNIEWLIAHQNDNGAHFTSAAKKMESLYVMDRLYSEYGEPVESWIDATTGESAEAKATWYTNMFDRMKNGFKVLEDGLASSNSWIQFALESGLVTMEQVDKSNIWVSTIHTNISDITEVTDDVAVAKAEAEYKKAMNNIENKDKRYDIELKNIDTEHNSLQKEYESVKKVIDQNIQRTFKIYS